MTTSCWLLVGTDNGQAHISEARCGVTRQCFDSYKIDRLTDSLTLSYTFSMAQDKQVEVYRMALKEARSAFDRAHSRVNEMAMETARLKREYGRQISFWGGGCDTGILQTGSPAEVRGEVRRRLADLAPEGGFIFGSIHNIQVNVPPANIVTMFDTARDEGHYGGSRHVA